MIRDATRDATIPFVNNLSKISSAFASQRITHHMYTKGSPASPRYSKKEGKRKQRKNENMQGNVSFVGTWVRGEEERVSRCTSVGSHPSDVVLPKCGIGENQ